MGETTRNKAYLLAISPLTPLHMGTGRSGGVVDLPVQRDTLGYPVIYASSLKGAFKSHLYRQGNNKATKLLGPEPDENVEKYSSPVSFLDAILLMLPVRVSADKPIYVTSPLSAGRALDYIAFAEAFSGASYDGIKDALRKLKGTEVNEGEIMLYGATTDSKEMFIAGERLKAGKASEEALLEVLSGFVPEAYKDFTGTLGVVDEPVFLSLVERMMIRQTRVRLDRKKKTVEKGGLWTEEYVPPGSAFFSVLLFNGKYAESLEGAEESLETITGLKYLVVGGKESVGKGVVKLHYIGGGE